MSATLSIGDFSRATHLSVKTLRFYHQAGLLEPFEIDQQTGYRRYATHQIPVAQVIRRFRALNMAVDDIRGVLAAPSIAARNELIAAHLHRMEEDLERTRNAVSSLRDLLEGPQGHLSVEHRSVPAILAATISAVVDVSDVSAWLRGALGELHATVSAQGIGRAGTAGGIFADGLFTRERGEAVAYLPITSQVRPLGRVKSTVLPKVELAVVTHRGTDEGVDRAYGSLATYVTEHALAVAGPLREHYVVSTIDSPRESEWRTEIGWPIFATGPATPPSA